MGEKTVVDWRVLWQREQMIMMACACAPYSSNSHPPRGPLSLAGEPIPDWFSFASVIKVLREAQESGAPNSA